MKNVKSILTAGAITAFSFGLAFGADQTRQQTGGALSPQERAHQQDQVLTQPQHQQHTQQQRGLHHKASQIEGSRVQSSDGERLGTVDDLAVDLESGEVSYLIVSSGGFLGIGGDLRPVPPEAVQVRQDNGSVEVVLQITEQQWENAPTVEREQIAQLGQETRGQEIYRFYGQDYADRQQRQAQFGARGQQRDQDRDIEDLMQQHRDRQQMQQDGQQQDQQLQHQQQHQQPGQQRDQAATGTGAQTETDTQLGAGAQQDQQEYGATNRDNGNDNQAQAGQDQTVVYQSGTEQDQQREFGATQRDQQQTGAVQQQTGAVQQQRVGQESRIHLSSDLRDKTVMNAQQQELGEVSDLLVNLEDGSIAFVLFEPATGFWETADDTFAVAPNAIQVTGEDRLTLNITQQDLQQAQTLSQQNIQQHAQQTRMAQQTQQAQVFRYQSDDRDGGLFGSPGRDRGDRDRDQRATDRDTDREGMTGAHGERPATQQPATQQQDRQQTW